MTDPEHVDVLIVGAGLSGIGAAHYLQTRQPGHSYAIVEARAATGGTWDLFRYPGTRSDSDPHTLGYGFKPWRDGRAIAGGDAILAYLRETAAENGIDRRVRLHHRAVSAAWSSDLARWLVDLELTDTGERTAISCRWLFGAGGYYRHDEGFVPQFPGREQFLGPVVHPQHWPADLDYAGKRVVVIGSGATAVTLVPAMASTAGHVTMLQRTPSYVLPVPAKDAVADLLRRVLGDEAAHPLIRGKNIARQRAVWRFCRRRPRLARRVIRWVNVRQLPPGYRVDDHFNPPYEPWDQRLCVAPDGDLFRAIRNGSASVVTDGIDTFTATGIRLSSGADLAADLIVTATGLNVQPMGGLALVVDGAAVHLPDTVSYKGMMLSGVPNFAYALGYANASWTLKVGLVCEHLCRLLGHMHSHGYAICRPEVDDPGMTRRPVLDLDAGYVRRAIGTLPRQGDIAPWLTSTDYHRDVRLLRRAPVVDRHLHFRAADPGVRPSGTLAR